MTVRKNVFTPPVAATATVADTRSAFVGTAVWLIVFVATFLMLLAAIPDSVTYRISVPAGRALSSARAPLTASALALMLGVALALLTGNA